ncbi:MAG: hypothetical protein AAGB51_06465 [Planctomycetota bacterium]
MRLDLCPVRDANGINAEPIDPAVERSAHPRWARPFLSGLMLLLPGVAIAAAAILAVASAAFTRDSVLDGYISVLAEVLLVWLLAASTSSALVRLWFFVARRRLVPRAVARSGVCGTCRYPIGSLPKDAQGNTVCPECGLRWLMGLGR